jgi:hypothetical protein
LTIPGQSSDPEVSTLGWDFTLNENTEVVITCDSTGFSNNKYVTTAAIGTKVSAYTTAPSVTFGSNTITLTGTPAFTKNL